MGTKKKAITIYDDDGILVEQTPVNDIIETVSKVKRVARFENLTKEITAKDLIGTLAGYMSPRFGVNKAEDGAGECVICGAKTQYTKRKMCVDCIENYGVENLLAKLGETVDDSEIIYLD